MGNSTNYANIDSILVQAGSQLGAAEAHGLQSGLICANDTGGEVDWRTVLMRELDCSAIHLPNIKKQLHTLHELTLKQLHSMDFSFDLLLPDDDNGLSCRVLALAQWCRGFLCGLGLAGINDMMVTSEIAKEAIEDLSNIAHARTELADTEEDEIAFVELVEYVRVAVQTVKFELKVPHGKGCCGSNLH